MSIFKIIIIFGTGVIIVKICFYFFKIIFFMPAFIYLGKLFIVLVSHMFVPCSTFLRSSAVSLLTFLRYCALRLAFFNLI